MIAADRGSKHSQNPKKEPSALAWGGKSAGVRCAFVRDTCIHVSKALCKFARKEFAPGQSRVLPHCFSRSSPGLKEANGI